MVASQVSRWYIHEATGSERSVVVGERKPVWWAAAARRAVGVCRGHTLCWRNYQATGTTTGIRRTHFNTRTQSPIFMT